MKVTLFMAMTVNGIIAGEGNEEDFLSDENWETFIRLANKIGCIVWGRKTHDVVLGWEEEYWRDLKDVTKIIVSRQSAISLKEQTYLVHSPQEALEKARQLGFSTVLLTGGAKLNSSFFQAELIDEVIINIEPVLVGNGIPLLASCETTSRLQFKEVVTLPEGIVQLHYRIIL